MPRIIAGALGGRTIPSPPSDRTRPTSDRVREALFSRLASWGVIEDAVVLDLFAGTGALGFEALSRGARHVSAYEAHGPTAAAIRRSARQLGLEERMSVHAARVTPSLLASLAPAHAGEFSLVFADPPYVVGSGDLGVMIEALGDSGTLAPECTLVIEQSSRAEPLSLSSCFVSDATASFGDTRLDFLAFLPEQGGA